MHRCRLHQNTKVRELKAIGLVKVLKDGVESAASENQLAVEGFGGLFLGSLLPLMERIYQALWGGLGPIPAKRSRKVWGRLRSCFGNDPRH